uniref:Uncharacterized protein n=1 Tax=Ornithorhynchus anatinus TaxID=9258 RepID=F7CYC4_ORNAN
MEAAGAVAAPAPAPCPAGPGTPPARDLLDVERGYARGLRDTLLLDAKRPADRGTRLQTVRMERSSLLDTVQNFLPQMERANNDLRERMAEAPPGLFDIENIDDSLEKIIEMDLALVEMSGSETDGELSSEESSDSDNSGPSDEVTIHNIKFPKPKGEKGIFCSSHSLVHVSH